jgi:hypothetical protein
MFSQSRRVHTLDATAGATARLPTVLPRDWRRLRIGGLAIFGGTTVMVGTLLPWVVMFAGLQRYPGIIGLHGRLLFGGGAAVVLGGTTFLVRGEPRLRWGLAGLGFALLAFASWLLIGAGLALEQLSNHPLMLARLGPGLIVVEVGAFLSFATVFLEYR